MRIMRNGVLIASSGPLKPPMEWFEDPQFSELSPLKITKEGRVYGHLADWDGCHTGFQGICVPPFRSSTNYAYFNTGEIETGEGDLVPCGKIMFCREGNGHAPLEMTWNEASRYYDDATKVGAFVRAGSDRFGTWLAGSLRHGLNDLEIQHLRTHPPSGDWRPVRGGPSELIAAFAVPIGGFPIARERALVASAADGEITAVISAPLFIPASNGAKLGIVRKKMLSTRLRKALGRGIGEWSDGFDFTAEQRSKWAKKGIALSDGSFPIPSQEYAERAIEALTASEFSAPRAAMVERHIRRRVKALNCSGEIFDNWK